MFAGADYNHFKDAYKSFLEIVANHLGVPQSNILICAGNHDVDQSIVSEPVKDYVRKATSSQALTKIVEENKIGARDNGDFIWTLMLLNKFI